MLYGTAIKTEINLYNLSNEGPPISAQLQDKASINDRKPGIATIGETSKLKIGKK